MVNKLGLVGVVGFLLVIGGVGLVAAENLYIAAGISFVISGLGLVVYGMIQALLEKLGMR